MYLLKRYRQGLDLLIHKDPEDYRQHILSPILIFDIEANMHNKHLVRKSMRNEEEMEGLTWNNTGDVPQKPWIYRPSIQEYFKICYS